MQVIRQAHQMARLAGALIRKGQTIGFVPTMGALHDGHLSLIRAAARETRVVVASLFVNPLQFGPHEDFERYPRDLKRDLNLSKAAGCDIVFAPDVSQIYPAGFCTSVEVEGLGRGLEGQSRPGHFRGASTVVLKLLHLVRPTVVYLGQKDYQQAVIIQRLVKDLSVPVQVRLMPTVREPDGLAMSSRNASLDEGARRQAPALFRALQAAREQIREGERDSRVLIERMRARIRQESSARVDYLALVDANTLEPLKTLHGRVAILGAMRLGSTRLIDNLLVAVP